MWNWFIILVFKYENSAYWIKWNVKRLEKIRGNHFLWKSIKIVIFMCGCYIFGSNGLKASSSLSEGGTSASPSSLEDCLFFYVAFKSQWKQRSSLGRWKPFSVSKSFEFEKGILVFTTSETGYRNTQCTNFIRNGKNWWNTFRVLQNHWRWC